MGHKIATPEPRAFPTKQPWAHTQPKHKAVAADAAADAQFHHWAAACQMMIF